MFTWHSHVMRSVILHYYYMLIRALWVCQCNVSVKCVIKVGMPLLYFDTNIHPPLPSQRRLLSCKYLLCFHTIQIYSGIYKVATLLSWTFSTHVHTKWGPFPNSRIFHPSAYIILSWQLSYSKGSQLVFTQSIYTIRRTCHEHLMVLWCFVLSYFI